jgi:hypothetical protein
MSYSQSMRLASFIGAIFLFVVAISACSSPESALIGKWEEIGYEDNVLEFFKDGTVLWGDMTLNYRILDKDRIRIDSGNLSLTLDYSVTRNSLTISDGIDTSEFRHISK